MRRPLDASHPVVFFANGAGDHLINLPALRALAALFPDRLRLVCMPGSRATFFGDLPLKATIETAMWSGNGSLQFDAEALAAEIGICDLFISLVPWYSESMDRLLDLLAPGHSKGFFPGFDDCILRDHSKHSADLAFDMVRRFDPDLCLDTFSAPPAWPSTAARQAFEIRREVPESARLLVIHADTKPEKMWILERWITFLDSVLERWERLLVFVVGRTPLALDCCRHGERVMPCYGLSIATSLALVGLGDVFVGVDSCMLHAADFCRVPGVGLFGPTSPQEFGFRLTPHRHVMGGGTMESIGASQVIEAFEELPTERLHELQDRSVATELLP